MNPALIPAFLVGDRVRIHEWADTTYGGRVGKVVETLPADNYRIQFADVAEPVTFARKELERA